MVRNETAVLILMIGYTSRNLFLLHGYILCLVNSVLCGCVCVRDKATLNTFIVGRPMLEPSLHIRLSVD